MNDEDLGRRAGRPQLCFITRCILESNKYPARLSQAQKAARRRHWQDLPYKAA